MTHAIESAEVLSNCYWRKGSSGDLEKSARKIQSVWHNVWHWSIRPFMLLWEAVRSVIVSQLRDTAMFPLKPYWNHEQMKIETKYFADYWNPAAPLDPNLEGQKQVRSHFTVRDETVRVKFDEQEYAVKFRIIESSEEPCQKWYNFVLIPGNQTTLENNAIGIHPLLSSYLALKKADPSLPPGRFITVTQYDIRPIGQDGALKEYQPASLDQAGSILGNILSAIHQEYGEIDQLLAHSLGCIIFSASLKHLHAETIPKHIAFHSGPSSLQKAAQKFWFGRIIYKLAAMTGWSINVSDEIAKFCKKYKETQALSLLISGVKQDHYFSGEANLCSSAEIEALKNQSLADVLLYDPPMQFFHDQAHHNLPLNFLVPNYLAAGSTRSFIQGNDHFAKALLRHSLKMKNPSEHADVVEP